jgi:hypothetical protein
VPRRGARRCILDPHRGPLIREDWLAWAPQSGSSVGNRPGRARERRGVKERPRQVVALAAVAPPGLTESASGCRPAGVSSKPGELGRRARTIRGVRGRIEGCRMGRRDLPDQVGEIQKDLFRACTHESLRARPSEMNGIHDKCQRCIRRTDGHKHFRTSWPGVRSGAPFRRCFSSRSGDKPQVGPHAAPSRKPRNDSPPNPPSATVTA